MPKRPVLSVLEILHKAQETTGGHVKYAKMLWAAEEADSDKCYQDLYGAISILVTVPQRTNAHAERVFKFLAVFIGEAPDRADDSSATFIQDLMAELLRLVSAVDKIVRVRACSLLAAFMQTIRLDLDDETLDELQHIMLGRLKDKVRMYAAAALERLADPGEDGIFGSDPVTSAYRKLLNAERNKDIRKCILGVMPVVRGSTLQEVLNRTRDANDLVRRQAYLVLATKCSITQLTSNERAALLRNGLEDRCKHVACAAQAVVQTWLKDDCESNILQLLELLDVERHPDAAKRALDALNAAGNLDLCDIAQTSKRQCRGLRSPPGTLLSNTEAFFWHWMVYWLQESSTEKRNSLSSQSGAEAHVASAAVDDILQVLDDMLPESSLAFAETLSHHVAAGRDFTFSTVQLTKIFACCGDFSDAASRDAALEAVKALINGHIKGEASQSWCKAVLELVKQVLPSTWETWLAEAASMASSKCFNECESATKDSFEVAQLKALELTCLLFQNSTQSQLWRAEERAVLTNLIDPAVTNPSSDAVRCTAARCLGLYSLQILSTFEAGHIPSEEQIIAIHLLRATLMQTNYTEAQLVAAKGLCDLLVTCGPKTLDFCLVPQTSHPSEHLLPSTANPQQQVEAAGRAEDLETRFLKQLLDALPQSTEHNSFTEECSLTARHQISSVLVEGLARTVIHHGPEASTSFTSMEHCDILQILTRLLVLWVDPKIELGDTARQAVSLFFPVYVAISEMRQEFIWRAALQAVKALKDLPPTLAKRASSKLTSNILQLLKIQAANAEVKQDGILDAAKFQMIELLGQSSQHSLRPWMGATLKLLAGLPIQNLSQEGINVLSYLAGRLEGNLPLGDMAHDTRQMLKRLRQANASPIEPLDEDSVAEICDQVRRWEEGEKALQQDSPISSRTRRRDSLQTGVDTDDKQATSSIPENLLDDSNSALRERSNIQTVDVSSATPKKNQGQRRNTRSRAIMSPVL